MFVPLIPSRTYSLKTPNHSENEQYEPISSFPNALVKVYHGRQCR